ncbi:MAG: hypothetical protein HY295_02845 [Thaumarchaeota archaeon]|nr:hypothetical protein [Nitrososphaerota archaeon]
MNKTISANRAKTSAANPTLDTIKMVEQTLSKMSEYTSKNRLWRALPKQVQYPTFKTVLDYLEKSNKIMYDKDGTIIWIFVDNPKLKRLKETSKSLL